MPHTDSQPALPFQGKTATSRHTGYLGAVSAAPGREQKRLVYLKWLRTRGPASDQAAADALRYPLASICSIRNGLVDRGLVEVAGTVLGMYGRKVALWRVRKDAAHV